MWIALLLSGVLALAEGSALVQPHCESTQKVDRNLVADQWNIGALQVPTLNIRNTVAEAKKFTEEYIKIWDVYGISVGTTDYYQILGIGDDLIKAIENHWAHLQQSLEATSIKNTHSSRINNDLEKMDDQLELFLRLEPGIQHIESELGNMPPQPVFESNNRNLTATEAFLRFAEIKDNEISLYMAFGSAMIWNGWRNARKYFGLLQTQYRNQILNNKVMPVYRRVVENVYSCGIRSYVDEETWARFVAAYYSIVRRSDAYIKSLKTGQECYVTQYT